MYIPSIVVLVFSIFLLWQVLGVFGFVPYVSIGIDNLYISMFRSTALNIAPIAIILGVLFFIICFVQRKKNKFSRGDDKFLSYLVPIVFTCITICTIL